ncbi:MAG: AraC family ligand binding domain-containing protein [Candidatus Andersenbacteria bacterium]
MEIILPTSKSIRKYTGEGGYQGEEMKIAIHKTVDILGFYKITIPKGTVATEHHHEHFVELFYLTTPLRIKINGEEYKLPSGTMVVLHPGDRHEEYADEQDVAYYVIKAPFVAGDKVMDKVVK